MEWLAIGIDPSLIFLELNLSGILISSLPVLGPALNGDIYPLPPKQERFKAMAFCDDVKPAICNLEEFNIADRGASLFEKAAGTRLHRDPMSQKCKFLPLGKWRNNLHHNDIPTPYIIYEILILSFATLRYISPLCAVFRHFALYFATLRCISSICAVFRHFALYFVTLR